MEAIKLCRLDTPIIFIEARINLSRFVVTGCAAKTSATVTLDRKSGSAGMPRPISYAVFCLKKKKKTGIVTTEHAYDIKYGRTNNDSEPTRSRRKPTT